MKKKLLLTLPPILLLLTLVVIAPKTLAQVASGNINILDISIDKGGGKVKSGDITIANTSIGDAVGGYFVTSGDTTVCAGHACKTDYDYEKTPILSELVVNAGDDAVAAGKYKTSGLRDDDAGQNYYNSLFIQPGFKASNPNDIEIAGVGFVEDNKAMHSFADLLTGADAAKGFVVIYVNENKDIPNIPKPNNGLAGCGFDFCKNFYYVYMGGGWQRPFHRDDQFWKSNVQNGITIRSESKRHNPPTQPAFNVLFTKDASSTTWGTYGFAFSKTALVVTAVEPQQVSTLNLLPKSASVRNLSTFESTFYLFNLF